MRVLPSVLLLLVPIVASADPKTDPNAGKPAPPPEVKATVDAFKGNWTFDATITATGAEKPSKFKIAFNCKAVAGGTAASCDARARTPQGPWNAMFLAAYDPYSKAVRFISVTNAFEVHDHTCQWKGTDLECAPLKGGTGPTGDEVTEEIKIHFDKRTATFNSTTKGKNGDVVFEGKGKK